MDNNSIYLILQGIIELIQVKLLEKYIIHSRVSLNVLFFNHYIFLWYI